MGFPHWDYSHSDTSIRCLSLNPNFIHSGYTRFLSDWMQKVLALQEVLLSHLSSLFHTNTPIPCTKNLQGTADDLCLLGHQRPEMPTLL